MYVRSYVRTYSSCEIMDQAWPIRDIESPRKERNAGFRITIIVLHEPEFVSEWRRKAWDFLGRRLWVLMMNPWITSVDHVLGIHHSSRRHCSSAACGGGRRGCGGSPFFLLKSNSTSIAKGLRAYREKKKKTLVLLLHTLTNKTNWIYLKRMTYIILKIHYYL